MNRLRAYAGPFYFAALLLLLTPFADFLANIWPLHLGNVRWRFGSVGLLAGMLLTPLIGLLVLSAVAAFLGHRRAQRAISVLSWIAALGLVAVALLFGLDALQLMHGIPSGAGHAFSTIVIRTLAKSLTVVAALIWLGVASWRASKERGVDSQSIPRSELRSHERADVLVPGTFEAGVEQGQ